MDTALKRRMLLNNHVAAYGSKIFLTTEESSYSWVHIRNMDSDPGLDHSDSMQRVSSRKEKKKKWI